MFLAEFAKKKQQEERKITLRERIVGTTNAGKAFRIGALASGAGLGYVALKNKAKLGELKNNPKDFFSKDAGNNPQRMVWYDKDGNIKSSREMNPPKNNPSFLSSGRKLNWGRVGKTAGIAGGALVVPTSAAYLFGDKKDREDIEKRSNGVVRNIKGTARDIRTWINTLHRVSR